MNKITELASSLKHSPMFQLSLSGKELFHSNLLAWLAEEYPDVVAKWLRERIGVSATTVVRVRRETHNFDLVLFIDSEETGSVVVIENKVKSLPDAEQLSAYTGKARELYGSRAHFLLLSLSNPASVLSQNQDWKVCRYTEYAEMLQTLPTRSDYHAALLSDYIFTIKQYSDIHTIAANIGNDAPLLGSFAQFEPLKDLRFDMFAVKVRYERVLQTICERLSIPVHVALSSNKRSVGDIRGYFDVSGSSRKPLVGLECVIRADEDKEPMNLGVQVEGNHFRLYAAQQRGGAELEQFATTLRAENRWFTFQETPELQALERLWGEDAQTKDFCGYSQNGIKNFVYCYKPFADAVSASELVSAVVAYMQYVRRTFA